MKFKCGMRQWCKYEGDTWEALLDHIRYSHVRREHKERISVLERFRQFPDRRRKQ